jgi:hypothetical protein
MRLLSTSMAYVKKQVLRPTFLGCEIIAFTLRDQQPKGTAAPSDRSPTQLATWYCVQKALA